VKDNKKISGPIVDRILSGRSRYIPHEKLMDKNLDGKGATRREIIERAEIFRQIDLAFSQNKTNSRIPAQEIERCCASDHQTLNMAGSKLIYLRAYHRQARSDDCRSRRKRDFRDTAYSRSSAI
jgi:predicted ATPase with chaperone activity